MTTTLTILANDIKVHEGLYSLNDLHKASGDSNKLSDSHTSFQFSKP